MMTCWLECRRLSHSGSYEINTQYLILIAARLISDIDLAGDALNSIDQNWAKTEEAKRAIEVVIEAVIDEKSRTQKVAEAILNCFESDWAHLPQVQNMTPDIIRSLVASKTPLSIQYSQPAAGELLKKIPRWEQSNGSKELVPWLLAKLRDQSKDIRTRAARVLGKIKDRRAVEPLIELLKDSEWSVRMEAIDALGSLNDVRAIAPLLKALTDCDESALAAKTLMKSAIESAIRRTQHKDNHS